MPFTRWLLLQTHFIWYVHSDTCLSFCQEGRGSFNIMQLVKRCIIIMRWAMGGQNRKWEHQFEDVHLWGESQAQDDAALNPVSFLD